MAGSYLHLSLSQLQSLAEQGDPTAQVALGEALEHGEGVGRNPALAIEWYCRAVTRGSVEAQRNLGWMYFSGQGVSRDDRRAGYWLGKAAAGGDEFSRQQVKRFSGLRPPKGDGCTKRVNLPWLKKRCGGKKCRDIVRLVKSLSRVNGLDPNLVLAVISAESAFNASALSSKGACGLMQLMPATAHRFGVEDPWDPEQNIRGGMAYLRWLLAYFEGDVERVLAAYNAGEQRVRKYGGVPPFPETLAYVKRILRDYGKVSHRYEKAWLKNTRTTASAATPSILPANPPVISATPSAMPGIDG
ncbi:MAG: transglycosylase SLT domain-containing protein [Gammaproteobacteria bacterium]|nr:transglycosylase SLT domain-containing protein [Gammaproteobacteria bacterium]